MERGARWEERQGSGGDEDNQGWLLEWETNLGMVMMIRKTLTGTSKAGFLDICSGGVPYLRWLLVGGGGGQIPSVYNHLRSYK